MLTVFRNDTLVKNEIISNYIRVYSSFLISSLGIFLICSAASKLYFSEHSFCVRGFGSFEIYFPTFQCVEPIVSIIDQKLGTLSNDLWTFDNPWALAIFVFFGRISS